VPNSLNLRNAISWKAVIAFAVTAISAVLIGLLILRYAVPIPMLDDWEMVPLVMKAHTGGLTFADLFAQQQESRTFLPKLIFIALSFGKYWDARAEMLLSVLLCCLSALGLYRMLGNARLSVFAATIVFLLSVLLIFSPAQHELWLLASGFPSFVPGLCIVWGINVATGRGPISRRFWLCALLAVCASFTLSNGLLAWGLTFPLLFLIEPRKTGKRWFAFWLIATAVCATLYFWHFHAQRDLPAFGPRKTGFEYWQYLAAFLGSGFGRAGNEHPLSVSITMGTALLLGYAAAVVDVVIRRRDPAHLARIIPWLALGGYSIGSGCLAALGRIEWGVAQALESRYVAYSLYLGVAIIVLAAIYWTEFLRTSAGDRRRRLIGFAVAVFLAGGCLFAESLCAIDSVAFFRIRSAAARLGYSAVLLSPALDNSRIIQAVNYPRPDFVKTNADSLDRLRLLRTSLLRTREIAKLRHADVDEQIAAGWCDGITTGNDGRRTAWGWAAFPAKNRPADSVLLAYADERGEWIVFALADAVLNRPDVARVLRSSEQVWSGWQVMFSVDSLPKNAEISAWALDAKDAKLYRLKARERILSP